MSGYVNIRQCTDLLWILVETQYIVTRSIEPAELLLFDKKRLTYLYYSLGTTLHVLPMLSHILRS